MIAFLDLLCKIGFIVLFILFASNGKIIEALLILILILLIQICALEDLW